MPGPADPARDSDPPEPGGADPGIPLALRLLWSAFAVWAIVYAVLYLVPEFRQWREGGR